MENKPTHTPTPWEVKSSLNTIRNADGLTVAHLRSNTEDADADAAFIVRAVNSHDELMAAIRYAVQFSDSDINPTIKKRLEQAIAKAEGQ